MITICCVGVYGNLGHGLIEWLETKRHVFWPISAANDPITGLAPSIMNLSDQRLTLHWLPEQDFLDQASLLPFRTAHLIIFFTGYGNEVMCQNAEDLRLWEKWASRLGENPLIVPIIISYYDEMPIIQAFQKKYHIGHFLYNAKALKREEFLQGFLNILNNVMATLPAREDALADLFLRQAREKLQAEEEARRTVEQVQMEIEDRDSQALATLWEQERQKQARLQQQKIQVRATLTMWHAREKALASILKFAGKLPKTLALLETFSPEEEQLYRNFKKELERPNIAELLRCIPKFPHEITFKFATREPNSIIYRTFCRPEFENCWKEQTQLFNATAANIRGMQRIHRSNFDIFLSYYLLSEYPRFADKFGATHVESWRLLIRACRYQGFHALYQRLDLIAEFLHKINHTATSIPTFNQELVRWCYLVVDEIADLWSPGLLAASRLALELAIYHLKCGEKIVTHWQWRAFYNQALRYIFLAQKLEDHPLSQRAKRVLFQDRPLLLIYQLKTWEELITWLLLHHNRLKPKDLTQAIDAAQRMYEKIAPELPRENADIAEEMKNIRVCNS